MSMPYTSFQQPFAPRKYNFSTSEGQPARVVIQTTFNLSAYDLSIEVDNNSEFRSYKVVGTAAFVAGEIVLNLTPNDVSEIKDSFYRVRATGLNRSFLMVTGSISYNPIISDNRILGPTGAVQTQFIGPLTTALEGTFLKKEDYLPPDLSRVTTLENTITQKADKTYVDSIGTSQNNINTIVRRDNIGDASFEHVFLAQFPDAGNHAANRGYVDAVVSGAKNRANHTGTQSADTIVDGTTNKVFTADHRTLLNDAHPMNEGWRVVRRDGTGSFAAQSITIAAAPSAVSDAVRKDYVDALGTDLATANTVVRRSASNEFVVGTVRANNAPSAASHLTRKDYVDGIGTSSGTPDTVVRRNASGNASFNQVGATAAAPVSAGDLTRKDYVDAEVRKALFLAGYGNSLWAIGDAEPFLRPSNVVNFDAQFATFSCFTAPVASTITKLSAPITAVGAGMTFFRMGVYTVNANGSLTLVARTDNVPSATQAPATAGMITLPLSINGGYPANFTFVPGTRYAFGLRMVGTTTPSITSWFMFEGGQYAPYVAQQLYLGTASGDLPTGTFNTGGTWWNAPYIAGLR